MGKFSLCLAVLTLVLYTATAHATIDDEPQCQCSRMPWVQPAEDECSCYQSRLTVAFNAINYTFSKLPSTMTDLTLGDRVFANLVEGSCPRKPMLRLSGVPRLSNTTTSLGCVRFCGFDFDNGRVAEIGSWLGDKKNQLYGLEVQCGSMRTLGPGAFSGYRNMRTLMIYRTGLEHIEIGAFSEMAFNSPRPNYGFAILVSMNNLTTFDWAVLKHVAPQLWSIMLDRNGIRDMRVTREVTFPALKHIGLTGNPLETIPQPVLDVWSQSTDLCIYLDGNPLCPQDALCRCCSLAALRKFATDSNSLVAVTCGDSSNGRAVNGTMRVCREKAASSVCAKDHFLIYNLARMVNVTSYDQCTGSDNEMACKLQ